jgi:hypothetical protein
LSASVAIASVGDQPARAVEGQAVGAVGVFEKRRDVVVLVDLGDAVGLGLGEDQAAVGQADRSLGAAEAALDHLDLGAGGNDAGNGRGRGFGRHRRSGLPARGQGHGGTDDEDGNRDGAHRPTVYLWNV